MKKRYLMNMTARVMTLMLSFLCLAGGQQVTAQSRSMGGGSSSYTVSSPQKVTMPAMTKGTGNAVSVNGKEYDTWENAVDAINNDQSENSFDIVLLNHVLDAKTMPSKACTIRGNTSKINFAYINNESYLTRIRMLAPLTFKDITLQIWQIAANGYALTFEEGVSCVSTYKIDQKEFTGIRNIWGGTDNSNDVENTNITIKSGRFGWVLGGSADNGGVTVLSKVTISGGSIDKAVFGAGYDGICGATEVKITGGTFAGSIYGGGEIGIVNGVVSLEIDGAKMYPTEDKPGFFSGCSIYGGGLGSTVEGEDTKGQVASTQVHIKSIAEDSRNVGVYGGGLYSNVTGNTSVIIEKGNIDQAWAGGYNYNTANAGKVSGDVSLLIKGGTFNTVGAARGQDSGKPVPVDGQMNITIEGGEVNEYILSGNEAHGSDYKQCTLTIRNMGTMDVPFKVPLIDAITNIVLENSTVAIKNPERHNIRLHQDHPVTISGDGKLIGTDILLQNYKTEILPANIPVVIADGLPATTTFANLVTVSNGKPVTSPVYKAGNTYRLKKDDETLYTVNMTKPEIKLGTLSVVWDKIKEQDVELEDGDQAPANTQLTVTFTPADAGIKAILKNNSQTIKSGEKLTLSADANITVETEVLPLNLSERKDDITISKEGDDWKYTDAAITKAPATSVTFNGTIKNTLAKGKRILIDKTAQGVLTFDNATINSTSAAAPALTIESGANVSFSGNLNVKTGDADQYAIKNDGSLTLTGASTQITSTNTNEGSDKGIQVGTDAVLVSEAGTNLIASGLNNEGIVVVKEGAVAQTGGGQDLQKTYLVTVVDPGNGNLFTVKAGDIEIKSNDKVADKTVLTVQATAANGYRLESITATPKDGQAVTLANNGTYQMTENEVTFKATFKSTYVPPVPTYYTVTLPEVEGATTNPKAGTRTVEEGYSFSFSLTLHEGYESSQPVVKANGRVVIPRESDGKYVIRNIGEDTEITIEGITKDDPTGNATIEGEIKVQAIGSALHIYLPKAETVNVYTLSGLLYEHKDLSAGNTQMQLSSGMYFVKIGEATYKIVIR